MGIEIIPGTVIYSSPISLQPSGLKEDRDTKGAAERAHMRTPTWQSDPIDIADEVTIVRASVAIDGHPDADFKGTAHFNLALGILVDGKFRGGITESGGSKDGRTESYIECLIGMGTKRQITITASCCDLPITSKVWLEVI